MILTILPRSKHMCILYVTRYGKNRPLTLKYGFAVGGSILDSTLFFRILFCLDIVKV